jgi:Retrotransposon gag protein
MHSSSSRAKSIHVETCSNDSSDHVGLASISKAKWCYSGSTSTQGAISRSGVTAPRCSVHTLVFCFLFCSRTIYGADLLGINRHHSSSVSRPPSRRARSHWRRDPTRRQFQITSKNDREYKRMSERILRSTSDKTNLFPPLSMTKREDPAMSEFPMSNESSQPLPVETKESQSPTSSANANADLQITVQMLHEMQLDIRTGIQELRKELKDDSAGRLDHMNTRMEQLASRIEQAENLRREETTKIQAQIDQINATNSTIKLVDHQPPTTAKVETVMCQGSTATTDLRVQNYNLVGIAINKQIDELKPYFGKKQESIDSWIKKIDKLAEIARMPDDEIFTLARLKLQGDAEKWWDNKKKEIDSWPSLKSKLIDTFGSLGKANKLELEALLHHRQQQLNEPATKYWNDMMSLCSAYDENMSSQDRVWRIGKGALPEFRSKHENKIFDDVDLLLKALIQHEESRFRNGYEEHERPNQLASLDYGPQHWQNALPTNQPQFSDRNHQSESHQPRAPSNHRAINSQSSNIRSGNNSARWNSNHPN